MNESRFYNDNSKSHREMCRRLFDIVARSPNKHCEYAYVNDKEPEKFKVYDFIFSPIPVKFYGGIQWT